jgi:acyl-ACP thioesterase
MSLKMNKFTQEFHIPCYNTDMSWRLKPAAFMDLAQEAANQHATILGFGYDDLIASKTAWVLSRMRVVFVDTPKWREEMKFQTWHRGLERLFFLRDFIMTDKDGKTRVKATTSWLVLNLENRRLLRDPNLLDEGTRCPDSVLDRPADKVVMPKDADSQLVGEHKVAYSDLDMNGHANNAMYMQWAMDAVNYEISATRAVKEFTINFNHEVKPQETVSIYKAIVEAEDGRHVFVEGKVAEQSSFCVEIVF